MKLEMNNRTKVLLGVVVLAGAAAAAWFLFLDDFLNAPALVIENEIGNLIILTGDRLGWADNLKFRLLTIGVISPHLTQLALFVCEAFDDLIGGKLGVGGRRRAWPGRAILSLSRLE